LSRRKVCRLSSGYFFGKKRIALKWKIVQQVYFIARISPIPTRNNLSADTQEWAKEKIQLLKRNKQPSLKLTFCKMAPKTKKQREVLSDTKRYFENHGHQMNYPLYKRMGFHVGSGVAEGACKHVIQSRFKRAGMRWSRQGAENLLALRSLHVNDKWELLQNYQRNLTV